MNNHTQGGLFYLGVHEPSWMARTTVPLFISARRLRRRTVVKPANGRWALDSGGFSELNSLGRWTIGPEQYAREAMAWSRMIGGLDWAVVQDWMCESSILAKTGLTVAEHQRRTTRSYLDLVAIEPAIQWVPVLQGYDERDYWSHLDQYTAAGVDLHSLPRVGVGSICRRQGTLEAAGLLWGLAQSGLALHGFGLKNQAIQRPGILEALASYDSLSWSFNARKSPPLPGCSHGIDGQGSCANCLRYALQHRERMLARAWAPRQRDLFTYNN